MDISDRGSELGDQLSSGRAQFRIDLGEGLLNNGEPDSCLQWDALSRMARAFCLSERPKPLGIVLLRSSFMGFSAASSTELLSPSDKQGTCRYYTSSRARRFTLMMTLPTLLLANRPSTVGTPYIFYAEYIMDRSKLGT